MSRLIAALGAGLLLTALAPVANAQQRDDTYYGYGGNRAYTPAYRGFTSTENERGDCVVNDGKPQQRLDLNRRCDQLEFWRRMDKR